MGKTKTILIILILLSCATIRAQSTLNDILYEVAHALHEDTTNTSTDRTERIFFINNGIGYLSDYGVGIARTHKFALSIGTTEYNLPTDFIRALNAHLYVVDKDSAYFLYFTEQMKFGLRTSGDRSLVLLPIEYTILPDSIIEIDPPPRVAGDTVILRYLGKASALSAGGDTCQLPDVMKDLLIDFVLAKTLRKDRMFDAYTALMQYVTAAAKDYARVKVETPGIAVYQEEIKK